MRIPVSAHVSLCLVHVAVCQIVLTVSQNERSTGGMDRATLEWLWRTTSRFVSLELTWDREFYGHELLYHTPWTRLLFDRVIYLRPRDVDDAELHLTRTDPDERGMEELRVRFLGTINHASVGTMRCTVTAEDGRSADKALSLNLGMKCRTYDRPTDGKTRRRTCAPQRYGWLPSGFTVTSILRPDDGNKTVLTIKRPGFEYIEYAPGCRLSCYLGPEGPVVSVTATGSCPIRVYEMEVKIGSWRVLEDRFELPR
ncbi:pr136 [rat cytomegalovirus strain Maastricht]|uniref:Pr136 n=1 Tax=Rat cytomegalovirus (strain Maastricht) TaxID=79700 RepID=Q9DW59_RCMVM|nr:pr136 [rat cytomegalovirus strain Maastricht]AAF99231.1 pr136 [rat cytomegalovirus strain Maastricht]WEG72050.1 protein m136 [Murid betaherpesvirus 2]